MKCIVRKSDLLKILKKALSVCLRVISIRLPMGRLIFLCDVNDKMSRYGKVCTITLTPGSFI